VIDATNEDGRPMMMNNVADKMMAGEIVLDQAEIIAKKSVAAWDEKKFIDSNRKNFDAMVASTAKANPSATLPTAPTDDQLRKQFLAQKAYSQTTLGEIYLKQGRTAEAEAAFKELYTTKPSPHGVAMAAGYLADLAKAAKQPADALEYLLTGSDNERLSPARRKDLDDAYKSTHNGSVAGLEGMLDARYEKNLPRPKVTPYVPTKDRADRVVLAEIFTGSGCPPCVGADVAFDGAMDRYKGQDLAVLMYHLHIPLPDPMTNPSTDTRSKFYAVHAVPAFYVDGVSDGKGGGPADSAPGIYKDRLEPMIEKLLTTKADAKLTLQAALSGSSVTVKAGAGKAGAAFKHVTLQIALAEERVHYAGENGVRFHPMVVRSLAGKDAGGFPLDAGKPLQVDYTFDLAKVVADAKDALDQFETKRGNGFKFAERKSDVDPKNLVVVAFLQDTDTKKVLQAAYVKVK
jgi:thiol-disulfide isomerase/thioredoxin